MDKKQIPARMAGRRTDWHGASRTGTNRRWITPVPKVHP